ncbi:hypothetical protein IL308_11330 [Lactococcus lactis]|uniref:hypothetical protein n=1 Tax=Lactococcus lactis TaxID=1358 RepID=UPI0019119E16|nr:hypothetical protein [Lactococcus lactis]MBK5077346.1 hypothetical protein [Lactococcus lactis]
MNEETFNRTKRMFLKRLADNFWYDGQWKFSYTLKKNHQIAREQRSRVTQALRRCVTSEIFPTANILKNLTDYFTAEELADVAEARIVQEERLREEKRQHMKILGTVRSAKRQRLTNLIIEPKTEVTLPNGNRAEFISKTEGGNFIFKEIKDYSTHLLTEQEARWIVEGK